MPQLNTHRHKQQRFSFPQLWRLEARGQVLPVFGFWWGLSPWLVDSLLLAVSSHRGQSALQSFPCLLRALVLSDQGPTHMTSCDFNYFFKGPISKYSHIGCRALTSEFGQDTNIQSILYLFATCVFLILTLKSYWNLTGGFCGVSGSLPVGKLEEPVRVGHSSGGKSQSTENCIDRLQTFLRGCSGNKMP